jgi:hypothetical protein
MPTPKIAIRPQAALQSRGKVKRPDRSVIGGTGLDNFGFIHDDFIQGLNGLNGVRAYREMMDNDPVIFGMLYAIGMLIRGVNWHVEPATGPDVDEELAQQAADFVSSVFLEDMDHPWEEFISEVISFLGYGHDVHEIVYKIRGGKTTDPATNSRFDDNRIGIRKLAPRAQDTIWRWDMEQDATVKGLWQTLPDRANVYLPIEKILLFRTTSNKGNPEGRSILRGSYVPYTRKQTIEAAEGRAAMRTAGLVELAIPAQFMSPDADDNEKAVFAAYKAVADSVAQDRQGSIVLPSDRDESGNRMFSVAYISTDGRRPADMTNVIERYDKRIAASVLADFMLLGQQAVGSFALSSDKTQLFSRSLTAYLDMIQAPINRVLIPRLWEFNGFDEALMPKFIPGAVSSKALGELGTYISSISSAGARLFPDKNLENVLRDAADLPELTDDVLKEQDDAQQKKIENAQQMATATAPATPKPGQPGAPKPGTPKPPAGPKVKS